jgi:hypothetical protein
MANWLLVAMLLRISDAARKPVTGNAPGQPGGGTKAPPAQLHGAMTEVIRP